MNNFEVLSVGGSLVCPEKVDLIFLKKLKRFLLKWIKRGKKFVLVVGGGKVAREYQRVAKALGVKDNKELDWIGIFATFLNAQLVKSLFSKIAFPQVITDPTKKVNKNFKVFVAAGWKPQRSTDFDATLLAKNFGAKRVINLSNIDYVYDKDPSKFKDAKPIKKISFSEFFKIVGKKWKPGAHLPFDPLAAKLAQKEKIKVLILNGKKFHNLEKVFKNQKFIGTQVEP